ncbi:hypothetical protein BDZ45DRAFT_668692 [Acephala macrosclerotiorum]|nr:hypothetical protein BDZ45DRAFT_668692 [Acephala macrosclerotiorum]
MKEKTYLKRFGHEIALPIYKPDSEPNSHLTTLALFDWTSLAIITLLILTSALLLSNSTTYPTCAFPSPLHIGSHLSPSTWTALVSIQFSLFGTVLLPCLLTLFTSKLLARNLTTGNGMKISTLLNTQESAPLRTQYRHGNLGLLVFKVLTKAGSFILCITCIFSFQALPARGNTGITLLGSYLQIFAWRMACSMAVSVE